VLASLASLADGVHSTLWLDAGLGGSLLGMPWYPDTLLLGTWIGLGLSAVAVIGFARSKTPDETRALGLLLTLLAVHAIALLLRFLWLPYYCAIKSSIALGWFPLLIVAICLGLERLAAREWSHFAARVFLCAIAVLQIWTYWPRALA
jgi:hypothetical protein